MDASSELVIPSIAQLMGIFDSWPTPDQQLMAQQPIMEEQIHMCDSLATCWPKDVYTSLGLSAPQTNEFLISFSKILQKHLPDYCQNVAGVVYPHALEFGMDSAESAARRVIEAFPNTLLSIEELHNFEIIFPSFRAGEKGSLGHANLFVLMSVFDSKDLDCWPLLHWDSIGI